MGGVKQVTVIKNWAISHILYIYNLIFYSYITIFGNVIINTYPNTADSLSNFFYLQNPSIRQIIRTCIVVYIVCRYDPNFQTFPRHHTIYHNIYVLRKSPGRIVVYINIYVRAVCMRVVLVLYSYSIPLTYIYSTHTHTHTHRYIYYLYVFIYTIIMCEGCRILCSGSLSLSSSSSSVVIHV